ncbi:MocR-like transcription factor YczR [Glutamicibacter endophyticus]
MRRITAGQLAGMLGVREEGVPAYRWLSAGLRSLIANGRVLHGTTLPSERDLVSALGLSRTTITRAYQVLREAGYADSAIGSGTVAQVPGGLVDGGGEPLPLGGFGSNNARTDLSCAAPAAPPGIMEHYAAALEQLPAYTAGMGYFPLGIPVLRQALADYYTRRGLPTDPDQIIVTAGSLAGVAAVARTVLSRGALAATETPSYPNSVLSLKAQKVRLAALPIGPEGSDLPGIETLLREARPAAMLCLPDFHNPVGTLLDNAGRERWARALQAHGTVGIVDETCVDLWLDEEPDVLPMAAFSSSLVSVGSASKSHWGGLRMGWIRAPRPLIGALATGRMVLDLGAPVLDQLVLASMLERRQPLHGRAELRANRDWLHAELARVLPEWTVRKPSGGLSLWCQLPAPRSSALCRTVRGVQLAPGSTFAVDGHGLETWLRLPYALPREDLAAVLPRIVEAWHAVA